MMMMMILAMILIFRCFLSAIDFAIRYSTRYSDFFITTLLEPYSESKNPTRWALFMRPQCTYFRDMVKYD